MDNRSPNDHHTGAAKAGGTTLEDIRRDAVTLKDDASKFVTEKAEAGVQAVRHTADSLVDSSKKAIEKTEKLHESLCRAVAARPTTALLLALGVGVLVGRVLRAGR